MFRLSAIVYGLVYIIFDPYKYTIANCQETAVLFYAGGVRRLKSISSAH
jgi:hypothetical protein